MENQIYENYKSILDDVKSTCLKANKNPKKTCPRIMNNFQKIYREFFGFFDNVKYADLATYFVANDAQDQEWVAYWECDTEYFDNNI